MIGLVNINDRNAGERLLSIYWFFILMIVGIGIVIGVFIIYSTKLDVRGLESEFLSDRILECLVDNGKLNNEIFDDHARLGKQEFEEYLESICRLNLDDIESEQYYVFVGVYDYDSCKEGDCEKIMERDGKRLELETGNRAYRAFCEMQKEEGKKGSPYCFERMVYVFENNKPGFLKILAGVGKLEKNVK